MKNKESYDPVEYIEDTIKDINNSTGKRARSILKKYTLTFSLLITFSLVSILHGFELVFDEIPIIQNHPWILILIGLLILIVTGSVYKTLERRG